MIDLNDPNIPIIGAKPKMTDEEAGNAILGTLQMLVTLIRDMLPYVENHIANTQGLIEACGPDCEEFKDSLRNAQHICSAVYEFLGEEE